MYSKFAVLGQFQVVLQFSDLSPRLGLQSADGGVAGGLDFGATAARILLAIYEKSQINQTNNENTPTKRRLGKKEMVRKGGCGREEEWEDAADACYGKVL